MINETLIHRRTSEKYSLLIKLKGLRMNSLSNKISILDYTLKIFKYLQIYDDPNTCVWNKVLHRIQNPLTLHLQLTWAILISRLHCHILLKRTKRRGRGTL